RRRQGSWPGPARRGGPGIAAKEAREKEDPMGLSAARHLRSNLVAYLALFFALSSTGYAAATKLVAPNSVGSKQVINGSLLKNDFRSGQLPQGQTGPAGAPGPPGPQGPVGNVG